MFALINQLILSLHLPPHLVCLSSVQPLFAGCLSSNLVPSFVTGYERYRLTAQRQESKENASRSVPSLPTRFPYAKRNMEKGSIYTGQDISLELLRGGIDSNYSNWKTYATLCL